MKAVRRWQWRSAVALLLAAFGSGPATGPAGGDDPSPFGVASSAQSSGAGKSWMPQVAVAGVRWARLSPEWGQMQPGRGRWNWRPLDDLLEVAAANHIGVSGLWLYNAPWVNADGHTFPVNDLPAWSAYVGGMAGHARGRVRYWEVWNEPQNFASHGTAEQYGTLVAAAYDAARKADPDCKVGIGVASVDLVYLERAIRGGAAGHYDYVVLHPYETLGRLGDGFDVQYLGVVRATRRMLAAADPGRADVPVWFTEVGTQIDGKHVTPDRQAADLVKAFVLSLAQGVARVEWYEARDGDAGFGLLDGKGEPRPAYVAMKSLTTALGQTPAYAGWVALPGDGIGYCFDGAAGPVMAAWVGPGRTGRVTFAGDVIVVNPTTGQSRRGAAIDLSAAPTLVVGLPTDLVAAAKANRGRPFPWGGDYTGADAVTWAADGERGLHLARPAATPVVTVDGVACRDVSPASGVSFAVDPNFASYTPARLRVTATVRRKAAGTNAGFGLKYESTRGLTGSKTGWVTVPADEQWHTVEWTLDDAELVGKWGYNLALDSDGTKYSGYLVRAVTVERVGDGGPR